MNYDKIVIHAGPVALAYADTAGVLEVWVGAEAERAPATATRNDIAPGCSTWSIFDDPPTENESVRAAEQHLADYKVRTSRKA